MYKSKVLLVGVAYLLRHKLHVIKPDQKTKEMEAGKT